MVSRELHEKMRKYIEGEADPAFDELWIPSSYQEKIRQEELKKQFNKDLMKTLGSSNESPTEKHLRKMEADISEVKGAIRKLGVLLDSDAPTKEQLEKYKTLKDAYNKYKMVEKLILGGESK